jgi:hypothetical protein
MTDNARFPDLARSKFKFLLIGAGRSGTSLLAALLDQHPAIEVGFELFGNACLRGKELEESRDTMFDDRAGSFIRRCIEHGDQCDKPIWGKKITTEILGGLNRHNLYNAPPVAVLPAFFNDYLAGLKVVYILRDGRACVQSKLRRTSQPMERACDWWKYAVEIYEFLQQRNDTCFVRYEELLASPPTILGEVCTFLGVEFDPLVLQGTTSDKLLADYRNPGIDRSRANDFDADHPSTAYIADELRRCGYTG